MLLGFPLLAALGLIPTGAVLLLFRKTRMWSAQALIASILMLSLAIPLMPVAGKVRMQAFRRLESRSAGLVAAIATYEKEHGAPPGQLTDLVPRYLNAVPSTQIGAYPAYSYVSGSDARKWNDNPWVLYVETPSGVLNWDMFLYFPRQNYPSKGYGGHLERIGTWAYVHE